MLKNTAPAITLAALLLDPIDTILVLPADHFIEDKSKFFDQVYKAIEYAKDGKIVTFGIKPFEANTNYGYIETTNNGNDFFNVNSFKEKNQILQQPINIFQMKDILEFRYFFI